MSKTDKLFGIANGWIHLNSASGRITKEYMDSLGRQLGALPFETIQSEVQENDELFVVFYDVKNGPAEAFLVIGPEDLLEIEEVLWEEQNWRLFYYAVPLEVMCEGLRHGQYLARCRVGRSHI